MTHGFADLFRTFGRIGLLSFGGPAAQIALMHDELVDRRRWLREDDFLRALSLCMLLPGPEAMQLATYAGWRLRGVPGGLLAGSLFVLPGACLIGMLAALYVAFGDLPLVQAGFLGIKATVIVIVLQALWRLGRRALGGAADWALACLAFLALFVFGLPFPAVIAAAALFGALRIGQTSAPPATTAPRSSPIGTVAVFAALWATPLVVLWATDQSFLLQIGLFFSKLAVVTFGGAYAVLAYMTQAVVQDHGWVTTGQMIDALGLAETTPGPLILVTEFVAILAGYGFGGVRDAVLAGLIALWVTFVPCFLWIFAAGPFIDRLARTPRLAAALGAVTAAVVGVIANLSVWFAIHVLFRSVGAWAPLALPIPDPASLNGPALAMLLAAAGLLLVLRLPLVWTLAVMALASVFGSVAGFF